VRAVALHPFDPQDHALLQAINRGEFTLIGIRNRDLQGLLYAAPARNKVEQRRRSSQSAAGSVFCAPTV